MRRTGAARAAQILVVIAFVVAAASCSRPVGSSGSRGSDVTILVSWSGPELTALKHIAAQLSKQIGGITVTVESTRSLTVELSNDLRDGRLPDVVVLPSIGVIDQYRNRLKPLPLENVADYGPPWSALMRPGPKNTVKAIPVKVDVKSLIWDTPGVPRRNPRTLGELAALSTSLENAGQPPWCLGVSTEATSGWPGTDWIADIMLSSYGPKVYQQWVNGELDWRKGPVRQAWKLWGDILDHGLAINGGAAMALRSAPGLYNTTKPPCDLSHGTLVDQKIPTSKPVPKFGTDYGFFDFPPAARTRNIPVQVSADFIGIFNNTPAARKLVRYLTGTALQRLFVNEPNFAGFSADRQVTVTNYPPGARRKIAGLLAPGHELCFGASDAMPPALSAAFDQAVLEYLAKPGDLWKFLRIMSTEQTNANRQLAKVGQKPPQVCGSPAQTRRQ